MASVETSKIQSKLSALSGSLDEMESLLEPLLSGSLAESVVNLEPLQQAKLQTVLPYAVFDLVFMYLKLEGIDPKTHPVINELGRIKEYFDKISNIENPPQRRVEVDQEAAGRFIKAAITQAKWKKTAAEEHEPEASTSMGKVPVKVTSKMLERQKYEEELMRANDEGEEEQELEVFNEDQDKDEGANAMQVDEPSDGKRKNKRTRPVLDPFQASGYGDEAFTNNTSAPATSATDAPKKKKMKGSAAISSSNKKKAK